MGRLKELLIMVRSWWRELRGCTVCGRDLEKSDSRNGTTCAECWYEARILGHFPGRR